MHKKIEKFFASIVFVSLTAIVLWVFSEKFKRMFAKVECRHSKFFHDQQKPHCIALHSGANERSEYVNGVQKKGKKAKTTKTNEQKKNYDDILLVTENIKVATKWWQKKGKGNVAKMETTINYTKTGFRFVNSICPMIRRGPFYVSCFQQILSLDQVSFCISRLGIRLRGHPYTYIHTASYKQNVGTRTWK